MPLCPVCSYEFADEKALRSHFFHRFSKCRLHIDDIGSQSSATNHLNTPQDVMNYDLEQHMDDYDMHAMDVDEPEPDVELNDSGRDSTHSPTPTPAELEEIFEGAGQTFGHTDNFYENIKAKDRFATERSENPFWPFSCFMDWEMGRYLESLPISQDLRDEFFRLQYVSGIYF